MTREAKAADILKAHRATAKVAKARELSPAFDAECRAAEQPVGFWQWAGYVHGRLRHDCGYLKMLALAGMILFLVWIAPFIWLLVKMFLILIPIWFFTTLGGPFTKTSVHFPDTKPISRGEMPLSFPGSVRDCRSRYLNRVGFVIAPRYPPVGRRCP
ncbi:MAG TPA: hypothetical protein VJK29_00365 [Terriglobales bacterium]|nr:hypothetical protein [Terriglobales bacterium]